MGALQPPVFKPLPQHQSLGRFVGTWRAEVKIWMEPGAEPMVSRGTMINTLALDGRFLQQDYRQDSGLFEGKGFWGYNDVDQRFEGFWIDSMSTMFNLEFGQYEPKNDRYVMEGTVTHPATRQPLQKRSVITYLNDRENTLEMFFLTGGKEFRTMAIHYQRA